VPDSASCLHIYTTAQCFTFVLSYKPCYLHINVRECPRQQPCRLYILTHDSPLIIIVEISLLFARVLQHHYSKQMEKVVARRYDPEIHQKLYHNNNPFILRKCNSDRRMQKCQGCKTAFKTSITESPKYIVAHRESYGYARSTTGSLLTSARDFYYHCNIDCIRPRHPYFDMSDITAHHATVRRLLDSDNDYLKSLGVFLCL